MFKRTTNEFLAEKNNSRKIMSFNCLCYLLSKLWSGGACSLIEANHFWRLSGALKTSQNLCKCDSLKTIIQLVFSTITDMHRLNPATALNKHICIYPNQRFDIRDIIHPILHFAQNPEILLSNKLPNELLRSVILISQSRQRLQFDGLMSSNNSNNNELQ